MTHGIVKEQFLTNKSTFRRSRNVMFWKRCFLSLNGSKNLSLWEIYFYYFFFFNLIFSPSRLLEKNGSVYEKLMKLLVYPSGAEKSNVKFQEG